MTFNVTSEDDPAVPTTHGASSAGYGGDLSRSRTRLFHHPVEPSEAVFDSLRSFVDALRAAGELREVGVEVDPRFEITEIANRCVKSPGGGPALLFTNVKDSRYPLLINALGSKGRMALALGVRDLDDLSDKVTQLFGLLKPAPLVERLGALF